MVFKIEGKAMYPILVNFAKYCWSVHSKVERLGKHTYSKQKSHSHITSAVSRQVYVHALQVQHRVYFFNIWFGTVQHQKQFGCREGRKIGKNIQILHR